MRPLLALAFATSLLVVASTAARADARVSGDRIEVVPEIRFATDRPLLRPESEAALPGVVALLAAHPEIERLRVEHFFDYRGSREHVRLLAEQRARAVADWLAVHGVDPLRLESAGVDPCRGTTRCDRALARHTVLRIVVLRGAELARLDRLRERRALFEALGTAALRCGGARTLEVAGRLGVTLAASCFFAPGATTLRREGAPLLSLVAREAATHRARRYTVAVEAAEGSPRPWEIASAQAAAVAQGLVAAGVSVERVTASARAANDEEIYDGPAHLAPGRALVTFALEADVAELR